MAVAWPTGVNNKAYGMNSQFVSNRKEITFESGKKRYYMLNSSPKKSFTFKVLLVDDGTSQSEFRLFLDWYENTLLSGTQTFLFPDLISHSGASEYRLTAEPSWSGQKYKEVSLSVQEE